jgi:hypothetical protein
MPSEAWQSDINATLCPFNSNLSQTEVGQAPVYDALDDRTS